MRIAILGRGISGLTAAHLLTRAGHEVISIDPAAEAGGLMRSERIDGFLCETGPQALLDGPAETRDLIAAAGLQARLVTASTAARRRFIHAGGRLNPLPTNPIALARSALMGWRGKLRLLREPFVRTPIPDGDESVLDFGTRRFGVETARALLAPAVIGVYAGDAARLSMSSAFPRLAALERAHGSVIRGAIAQRRAGGGAGRPVSFPEGLQELARALDQALAAPRRIVARAERVQRVGDGWRVWLAAADADTANAGVTDGGRHGAAPAPIDAQAVVIATDAAPAAALLDPLAPAAAAALRGVPLAPAVVAFLGFRAQGGAADRPGAAEADAETAAVDIGVDLRAYGFLVARDAATATAPAPSRVLGCQYESSIFPGRAPTGAVLLRAILGGTFDPGIVDEPDDAIVAATVADLRRLAGLTRAPDFTHVWRHRAAIPQYELGHAAKVAAADADLARHPGLYLIGHTLRGVGVNDCIATAAALVPRMAG